MIRNPVKTITLFVMYQGEKFKAINMKSKIIPGELSEPGRFPSANTFL